MDKLLKIAFISGALEKLSKYKFKNNRLLWEHYKKHKEDTGAKSKKEYLSRAKEIIESGQVMPTKENKRKIIDHRNREVVIVDPQKEHILTYYRRSGV